MNLSKDIFHMYAYMTYWTWMELHLIHVNYCTNTNPSNYVNVVWIAGNPITNWKTNRNMWCFLLINTKHWTLKSNKNLNSTMLVDDYNRRRMLKLCIIKHGYWLHALDRILNGINIQVGKLIINWNTIKCIMCVISKFQIF